MRAPRRSEAVQQLKSRFLAALQRNDAAEVEKLLRTTNIDIDTVFDVEDNSMVLASYKQGNLGTPRRKVQQKDSEVHEMSHGVEPHCCG